MSYRLARRFGTQPPAGVAACRFLLLAGLVAMLATGCKKADEYLGGDLLPGDGLGVDQVDTFTMKTILMREPSLFTDGNANYPLGSIYDPAFGVTQASLATALALPANNINLDGATLDSVVLTFALNPQSFTQGDVSQPFTVNVFELDGQLYSDSSYKSSRQVDTVQQQRIGQASVRFSTDTFDVSEPLASGIDSVYRTSGQLRIVLNKAWGDQFFDAANKPNLANTAAFQDWINGLYVTTEAATAANPGHFLSVNLTSAGTGVLFYYKKDGLRRRLRLEMGVSTAPRYSVQSHDYTVSSYEDCVNDSQSLTCCQTIVAHGISGLKTYIKIPGLANFSAANPGKVVNKAVIVFSVDPSVPVGPTGLPPTLALIARDSLGNNALLPDQTEAYYGGRLDSTNNSEYRFDISRYAQNVLAGKRDDGLYLLVGNSPNRADRVVLGGPCNPALRPRLILTFTTIK